MKFISKGKKYNPYKYEMNIITKLIAYTQYNE
jgi:hypothetical protein